MVAVLCQAVQINWMKFIRAAILAAFVVLALYSFFYLVDLARPEGTQESLSATWRNIGLIILAPLGFYLAWRRTSDASAQLDLSRKSDVNSRYQSAIEVATDSNPALRPAGYISLFNLTKESPDTQSAAVVDFFRAFLSYRIESDIRIEELNSESFVENINTHEKRTIFDYVSDIANVYGEHLRGTPILFEQANFHKVDMLFGSGGFFIFRECYFGTGSIGPEVDFDPFLARLKMFRINECQVLFVRCKFDTMSIVNAAGLYKGRAFPQFRFNECHFEKVRIDNIGATYYGSRFDACNFSNSVEDRRKIDENKFEFRKIVSLK